MQGYFIDKFVNDKKCNVHNIMTKNDDMANVHKISGILKDEELRIFMRYLQAARVRWTTTKKIES